MYIHNYWVEEFHWEGGSILNQGAEAPSPPGSYTTDHEYSTGTNNSWPLEMGYMGTYPEVASLMEVVAWAEVECMVKYQGSSFH